MTLKDFIFKFEWSIMGLLIFSFNLLIGSLLEINSLRYLIVGALMLFVVVLQFLVNKKKDIPVVNFLILQILIVCMPTLFIIKILEHTGQI